MSFTLDSPEVSHPDQLGLNITKSLVIVDGVAFNQTAIQNLLSDQSVPDQLIDDLSIRWYTPSVNGHIVATATYGEGRKQDGRTWPVVSLDPDYYKRHPHHLNADTMHELGHMVFRHGTERRSEVKATMSAFEAYNLAKVLGFITLATEQGIPTATFASATAYLLGNAVASRESVQKTKYRFSRNEHFARRFAEIHADIKVIELTGEVGFTRMHSGMASNTPSSPSATSLQELVIPRPNSLPNLIASMWDGWLDHIEPYIDYIDTRWPKFFAEPQLTKPETLSALFDIVAQDAGNKHE